MIKCICSPIVLLYHSLKIYLIPCLRYYIYKLVCCIYIFRTCFLFNDDEFNNIALGEIYEKEKNKIIWKRCYDNKQCTFISNDIHPSDVVQGNVGDCWLMSAIACLAEFHGPLHNLFDSNVMSVYGKYNVFLYNKILKKRQKITIDDKIPCLKTTGKPLFAQCKDNEIWPLILEKAFAKFIGDYSQLKGGSIAWALQTLTGDHVFKFSQIDQQTWKKFNIVHINQVIHARSVSFFPTSEVHDEFSMFDILNEYKKQNSILAAYISSNNEWKKNN